MLCFLTAGLLAQDQYNLESLPPFPDHVQYTHYSDQIGKGPALPGFPHTLPGVPDSAGDPVGRGGWQS